MMKKLLIMSLGAFLLSVPSLLAAPVSPDQARGIAAGFLSGPGGTMMMRSMPSAPLTLAYTHTDKATNSATVYAFNRGKGDGYILVAADDRAPLILGYADRGSFTATMPQSMLGMMESWSNQVVWLASHPDCQAAFPLRVANPVAPLLGDITWDQGDPYNRKCPAVTQYDSWGDPKGTGPAATGCVATALGQIMYYHKWPLVGRDSISYVSEGQNGDGDPENINIKVKFEGTQYQWDKMLPKVSKTSPADAIDAVSTLLFHVGASFQSIYGASTGATDVSVAPALMRYFNYDKGINYVKRDYFTTEAWNEMLLKEFAAKRPVAYGGVTRRGEGHFFVLDGVNAEGYWHVNWGWSGMEDGYYLLTLLEPGSQGTGGSSDGSAFHYAQNMITGIQKPVEGSQLNYNFTVESVSECDKTIGRQETAAITASGVWNDSPNAVKANLGFAMTDSAGNVVYRQMVKNQVDYPVSYGEKSFKCSFLIPDNIPAGVYYVRPSYQIDADNYASDRFMQSFHGRDCGYRVTVTDNNITWATQGAYKLTILEVHGDNEGAIESGVTTKITVKVRNEGNEFYGPMYLRMFINGKDRVFGNNDFPDGWTKAKWTAIPGNAVSEITFDVGTLKLPGHDDYVVRLRGNEGILNDNNRPVSAITLATYKGVKVVGPALPPVVELADDMICTTMVDGKVPLNDVGLKICLDNDGGSWTGSLRCSVKKKDNMGTYTIGYVTFDPVTIAAETKEQWLTLTGGEMPQGCEAGEKYELVIYDPVENKAMIPSYYYSIELTAGPSIDKTSVLTLDTLLFSPEKVVAGIPTGVQFLVKNTGYTYNGPLSFTVTRSGEVMHRSAAQSVSIPRNDDAVVEFNETFELPTANDYVVTLLDKENKEIGRREGLLFTADAPSLALTDSTSIPDSIVCKKITDYVFGVRNTGFRFDSSLHFAIFTEGGYEQYASESKPLVLDRGAEALVTFKATIDFVDGKYILKVMDAAGNVVGERNVIVTGYHQGIDTLESDSDIPVRYFNLQGVEIRDPRKGEPVIMIKGSKSYKIIVQ